MSDYQPSVEAALLHRLVDRFLDRRSLPVSITTENGALLLADWLNKLRFNREPFNFDSAARLGLWASPPLTCEAAITLLNRLDEAR
jgi:hypothetical protein